MSDQNWRDKPHLESLVEACRGRPAAVLGGGPSLLDQLPHVPDDALLFGVNHHAAVLHYRDPQRWQACDFLCFLDNEWHRKGPQDGSHRVSPAAVLAGLEGVRLTPSLGLTDYRVSGLVAQDWGWSSPFALDCALQLGCDPVVLCGFDCDTNGYCHDGSWLGLEGRSPRQVPGVQLPAWRRVLDRLKAKGRPVERVRCAHGRLAKDPVELPLSDWFVVEAPGRREARRRAEEAGEP